MGRSMFIAMKNSRHRIAAIALYRALIRTGQKITIPKDLYPSGATHPVVHLIRKRVSKNKDFTSLRLVYAAMAAGYRFLTMLTNAQNTSNPDYQSIIQHLRNRAEQAAASRTIAQAQPPRPPRRKQEKKPPLLTKVSGPNEPPKYASAIRPQPKSAFEGDRKVPVFAATAEGTPYLRVMKPQPNLLSRSIRQKQRVLREKVYNIVDINEKLAPFAHQEDNWDKLVRQELQKAGLKEDGPSDGRFGTYSRSQAISKLWYSTRIDKTWRDWIARGQALNQIAEDEKALAQMEQGTGGNTGPDTTKRILQERKKVKAAKQHAPPADPFLTPEWQKIVARNEQFIIERGQTREDKKSRQSKTESEDIDFDSILDPFEALSLGRKN